MHRTHPFRTRAGATWQLGIHTDGASANYTAKTLLKPGYSFSTGWRLTSRLVDFLIGFLWLVASTDAANVSLTTLYTFANNGAFGLSPESRLALGSDGAFYGTTYMGGTSNVGTLFRITTNGIITTLYSFTGGNDGANPFGGLVQASDLNFYGTAVNGGTNGLGACFKVTTNGVVTPLYSFTGNDDGANPYAALMQAKDGNLYGTTFNGSQGYGTVFRMTIHGNLTPLYSFGGGTNDGANPSGILMQDRDGNIYGTTQDGGLSDVGTIFQLLPGPGTVNILYQFSGGYDGANPYGGLVQTTNGLMFGTTMAGGTNFDGVIFSFSTNGVQTPLYSFTGYPDGSSPECGLVVGNDGNLYGTTYNGSTNTFGSVFKVTPKGNLTTLHAFNYDFVNGANPSAELVLGTDGSFYSTTQFGGVLFTNGLVYIGSGSIYRITTNGVLTTLHLFNNTIGCAGGLLAASDGNLYGTTVGGGPNNDGTIFRISTGGSLSTLAAFYHTNGANPVAPLTQVPDGLLYGAASGGGSGAGGTIFQVATNGALSTLASFAVTNGYAPLAPVLPSADGKLYGVTAFGGTNDQGYGTLFVATTNGNLTSLHSFTELDGYAPLAGLAQAPSGEFFGNTSVGGSNIIVDIFNNGGFGTVFAADSAGDFSSLWTFDSTNGANPTGALVEGPGGQLYGVTVQGGENNMGIAFSMTTNGSLNTLYTFGSITNSSGVALDGASPAAGLLRGSDANFYGVTAQGGASNAGTVFQLTPNGALSTLYSFTGGSDGATPSGKLVLGPDGAFYGTTTYGTSNNNGSVFRLSVPMAPAFEGIRQNGNSLVLSWLAVSNLTYQIQFKTNFSQSSWSNLGGIVRATNGVATTTDNVGPAGTRIYRAVLLP